MSNAPPPYKNHRNAACEGLCDESDCLYYLCKYGDELYGLYPESCKDLEWFQRNRGKLFTWDEVNTYFGEYAQEELREHFSYPLSPTKVQEMVDRGFFVNSLK